MDFKGNDIYLRKGDNSSLVVYLVDDNGNQITFQNGDIVYLTVKRDLLSQNKIIQKVITEFTKGEALINFVPKDTKNLETRSYYYDIQYTKADGFTKTIIPPNASDKTPRFHITPEVTHE